jgi:hypothetical protein
MGGRVPVHGSRSARHSPGGDGHERPAAGTDRATAEHGELDSDRGGDRGAVTVEAALALCSLAVFLAVAVGALVAVSASIRCTDAARELARLAARGEPARGHAVAAELAPAEARLVLTSRGNTVVAAVSVHALRPLPLEIRARAVAALEPGVQGP